jgi:protease-4
MRGFFKILLGSLAAILIAVVVVSVIGVKLINKNMEPEKPEVKSKTVLVIDLSRPVKEQAKDAGLNFPEGKSPDVLGLFDIVRAIKQAASDSLVKGIYIQCRYNYMGPASSTEVRDALQEFKKTNKFIIAAADRISEKAYTVAQAADKIYCQPGGDLEWQGYSMEVTFFKGALDKLKIEPEIFYAGQFKSATEPYRFTKMSDANRLQMTVFIEELYQYFLANTSAARNIDTAKLREFANSYAIRSAESARKAGLIDGAKYDDEVKDEIREKLGLKKDDKIQFMNIADYIKNAPWNDDVEKNSAIALIYAEGEITDGNGEDGEIGGDRFRNLIRRARMNEDVKAVVMRINSPGGSSLACEGIWREISLLKEKKPFVVSLGDYAASGGYYLACLGDSIFAQPNTLTGSIGVFSMYFNTQKFFNEMLGVTFDGVKTGPYADWGTSNRPMTDTERKLGQEDTDSAYYLFKTRVANGRKLSMEFVDSVAQGRVWTGQSAIDIKLVDKIGSLQDAVDCASRLAKLNSYSLIELPKVESFWKKLLSGSKEEQSKSIKAYSLQQEMGKEEFELYNQYKTLKSWVGVPQMRLPFFANFK